MISTLQDLIAPLSEATFLAHFRERTVAFVRTSEPQRFETLLGWDELNYLIESGLYPVEELRMCASMPIPTSSYIEQGRVDPAAFSSLMDRGADLIFNRLDKYVPRLFRLCHQIAEQTKEQVTAEAIVTSGTNCAWPHVNMADVCVLQIAGRKRWELYSRAVVNPLVDKSVVPVPQSAPFFNEALTAGDFLFVPMGYSAHCQCESERSLHLCIMFEPPCGRDVVSWLISQLMTDDTFNRPLTRYADTRALAAHETALKARLIEQVEAWSLASYLAERTVARSKEVVIQIQGTQNAAERAFS
jgi:bifunctional lysine-specific demethylase and histidyl-hydroxylase NO66